MLRTFSGENGKKFSLRRKPYNYVADFSGVAPGKVECLTRLALTRYLWRRMRVGSFNPKWSDSFSWVGRRIRAHPSYIGYNNNLSNNGFSPFTGQLEPGQPDLPHQDVLSVQTQFLA